MTTRHIVCAYAEPAAGPGWANAPLWIVERIDGSLYERCLQPHEQPARIVHLYRIAAAVHAEMMSALEGMK